MRNLLTIFFFSINLITNAQGIDSLGFDFILNSDKKTFNSDSLIFKFHKFEKSSENESILILKKNNNLSEFSVFLYKNSERDSLVIIDTINLGIFLEVKIIDIDNNGLFDLIIETGDNRPCNYIYLNFKNKLYKVDDCNKFTDFQKIENTCFGFTYKNQGCASNIWSSSLVYTCDSSFVIVATLNVDLCVKTKQFVDLIIFDVEDDAIIKKVIVDHDKLEDLNLFWKSHIVTVKEFGNATKVCTPKTE